MYLWYVHNTYMYMYIKVNKYYNFTFTVDISKIICFAREK